jgi:hypothetical protein
MPGTGFEFFPHWRGKWKPFTSYLFAATGGAEGIIATGRRIADDAGAGSLELPER